MTHREPEERLLGGLEAPPATAACGGGLLLTTASEETRGLSGVGRQGGEGLGEQGCLWDGVDAVVAVETSAVALNVLAVGTQVVGLRVKNGL